MKKIIIVLTCCIIADLACAQDNKAMIERACLDYLEGFYEGDTTKLIRSLKPSLYKFGYWQDKKTGKYAPDGSMTWRAAVDYAKRVSEKKKFAKPGSPKKVEVLDIMNTIAAAKVTAWWGVDYLLLAKQNDVWMIEQVLWEGPLKN
ncbi:MAG: nuclear transport factor 2 family protein [Ferruginibacter sp.]